MGRVDRYSSNGVFEQLPSTLSTAKTKYTSPVSARLSTTLAKFITLRTGNGRRSSMMNSCLWSVTYTSLRVVRWSVPD